MNEHDSERIAGLLRADNYTETDIPKEADLIILNTCSIRQKAEQKVFSMIGRLKKLKHTRPDLKIMLAGCIAQHRGKSIFRRAPSIDYVVGPQNINKIPDIIKNGAGQLLIADNLDLKLLNLPAVRKDSFRAWVNIIYGCNNFCSYCIVPYTRGREVSRPSDDIVNEVAGLVSDGYKEITLLGQNVNSYSDSMSFAGLLKELDKIKGIQRLRFMTSHPKDISDELIFAVRDLGSLCEHIHLPLQSGSTRILNLMNRKYTRDDYMKKIEMIKNTIPGVSITTDIIVGFPGESDQDHKMTIQTIKDIGYDGMYAFKYSPREGTKAATLDDQVDEAIKEDRLDELLVCQDLITENINRRLEGSILEVLVESTDTISGGFMTGRTRNNKIVTIAADQKLEVGSFVDIEITEGYRHNLKGKPAIR
ncbi:MAG: tRNA (N6-isopentenyl adenosine(37)-C2)-methylthiotransferase MiaB [Nitrospirae bacterium]|nr:tRNA (N6-isopentenyl adenosine(37)-C2)-methylthiotransferase MiaB [Nitrospirota bacterium]